MKKVLISIPNYSGDISFRTCISLLRAQDKAKDNYKVGVDFVSTSATPFCFNKCLQHAYYSDYDYWVMLHADIGAKTDDWLDVLLTDLETENLAVISAVAAIKSDEGLTSTAVMSRENFPRRLTLSEVHNGPEILTNDKCKRIHGHPLLINTGMMAWKMSVMREHIPNLPFEFHDKFDLKMTENGEMYIPNFKPEDWLMSERLNELGIAYGTTRRVPTIHCGRHEFDSSMIWGHKTDPQWERTKDTWK